MGVAIIRCVKNESVRNEAVGIFSLSEASFLIEALP